MILGVALVLLVVTLGVADYIYLGSLIHHTEVKGLQTAGEKENILLVGSTDRCALKHQNVAYGLCSQGVTGVNSDIVMIVHLDLGTHRVSLLSIARDTFIPNARHEGANKIDAALYQGPTQLAAAIQEDFGIPINHYIELNFDTFANVVDALGGIRLYFPMPVFDAESGLNIRHPGCYLLNGYHALQVVRARHLQYQPAGTPYAHSTWPQEAQSDIARIRRTHEFLRILAKQVASRGIGNFSTDQSIATSVLPSLTVDNGFSESHMVALAEAFATTAIDNVPQFTYPVVTVEVGSYLYKGYYYGDIEFPLQPGGYNAVDAIFGVKPGQSTFSYSQLPHVGSFRVAVENGSGVSGQAGVVAKGLTSRGFDVVATGDRTPVNPKENETIVWYGGPPPPSSGNWDASAQAEAEQVMRQIQGPAVMGYNPAMVQPGSSVTIETGNDISLRPITAPTSPTSTTTTTVKASPGTVTPTTVYDPPGVSGDNGLGQPTALAQPLQPWDPRSCNASFTGPGTY